MEGAEWGWGFYTRRSHIYLQEKSNRQIKGGEGTISEGDFDGRCEWEKKGEKAF